MPDDCDCKKKPEPSVCWPNDPDYLDGKAEIELPSEKIQLKVFWNADSSISTKEQGRHDHRHGGGLRRSDFRAEFRERLWKCITGEGFSTLASSDRAGARFLSVRTASWSTATWIPGLERRRHPAHPAAELLFRPGMIMIEGDTEVYESQRGRTAVLQWPRRGRWSRGSRRVRILQGCRRRNTPSGGYRWRRDRARRTTSRNDEEVDVDRPPRT